MHYSPVDIDIARQYGFAVKYMNQVAGKVILCENDLLTVNEDAAVAAETLGSTLMTDSETETWIREHLNTE